MNARWTRPIQTISNAEAKNVTAPIGNAASTPPISTACSGVRTISPAAIPPIVPSTASPVPTHRAVMILV